MSEQRGASPEHKTDHEPRPHFDLSTIMGIEVEKIILVQDVQEQARKQYDRLREHANPAQMAETAWALRRILQEALKPLVAYKIRGDERLVNPSQTSLGRVRHLSEDPQLAVRLGVYRLLLKEVEPKIQQELARHEQERNAINGSYEEFKTLESGLEHAREKLNALLTRMFKNAGQEPDMGDILERDVLEADIGEFERNLALAKEKNPNVAALIEYDTVKEYARQLRENGFIWTKSRQKLLQDVLTGALTSRPVASLMGETGSGKTAMARSAAIELSSREPERDVGGTTGKFERLLATVGGIKNGETYYNYGPLLRAMTGKSSSNDTNPSIGGGIFFDDEFNTRPTSVQRQILKYVSEARSGRTVSVPGTTISVTVEPGFLYLAAGNPPSERYDREETGIETKREFAGNVLNVEYLTQTSDNPELYQVLLASLLDQKTGRLSAVTPQELAPAWQKPDTDKGESHLDIDPTAGAFLWRFSNAWGELFKAFSHKDTVLHAKDPSKPPDEYYLPTFILDPGVVLTWMDRYKASPKDRKEHLAQFLLDHLTKYLSQFPEPEQKTVEAYLNHFGIAISAPRGNSATVKRLRSIHQHEQTKPPATVLTPQEMGYLNPNVPRPVEKRDTPPTDTLSDLIDEHGDTIGKYVRVARVGVEPNTDLVRRRTVQDDGVPERITFLGVGYNETDKTMDMDRIHVRNPDNTLKQYDLRTFKRLFIPETYSPPDATSTEAGELAPFEYDKEKAKEYGFSELKIEAHKGAQKIVDAIYARDPRFVMIHKKGDPDPDSTSNPPKFLFEEKIKLNEAALKEAWGIACLEIPNVPGQSMWYFQALAEHRLSNTIDGDNALNFTNPTKPLIPGFGQKAFLLTMDFKEFNWVIDQEKEKAVTPQTKKILMTLFGTQYPNKISRDSVNIGLWSDHENRVQSNKARQVIREILGSQANPDDYELRLIRLDEYQRSASTQGYGHEDLWSLIDGYAVQVSGQRSGLIAGSRNAGGAARVQAENRANRFIDQVVRLVLSRKNPEAPRAFELANLQEARDILGPDNVLGPEAVKATWDRDLAPLEIPPFLYSREQLEGAKKMNMMLVLRVDQDKDGYRLTGARMNEIIQPKLTATGKGKLFYDIDWYANEPFFRGPVPKPYWKLVTRDLLPNSTGLDYVDQTKLLRDTLAQQPDLTQEELSAIAQANDVTLAQLRALSKSVDAAIWKPAAEELAKLMINQNHRRSFADTIFDQASLLQTHNQRLFNGQALYDWTNDRSSDGGLVDVGDSDADGASVGRWGPRRQDGDVGVSFSR